MIKVRGGNGLPENHFGFPAITYNDVANENERPRYPTLSGGHVADVVVIGSGYLGLSAAWHLNALARSSGHPMRVVLVEADRIGSGASGKSAGHVTAELQARNSEVLAYCGQRLGHEIIAAAAEGPALVREVVDTLRLNCDLRDGYMLIDRSNGQSIRTDKQSFGINPYPFVLGMADAAQQAGVSIYEKTPAVRIEEKQDGCVVITPQGTVRTSYVVAAGAHGMAEIAKLSRLREKTLNLHVSTIITERPVPAGVVKAIMPANAKSRFPFCDKEIDVAYGNIDAVGRLIFGACDSPGIPNTAKIETRFHQLFPGFRKSYVQATGRAPVFKPFVVNECLGFTVKLLPDVGTLGTGKRIFYAQGLGGHGIGPGTFLGKAIAEKILGRMTVDPQAGSMFDLFASVKHLHMPTSNLFRELAVRIGMPLLSNKTTADKLVPPVVKALQRVLALRAG